MQLPAFIVNWGRAFDFTYSHTTFAIKHVFNSQCDHRAKAKENKRKIGDSSKAHQISESEEQVLVTPEINSEQPEEPQSKQDDPPPQIEASVSEAMHVDANPAGNPDLPSPKPSSPAQPINKNPADDNVDDIAIIGSVLKLPEVSRVLAKHSAKE